MIGSTIRSANRNDSTPENPIPPDHRTAASGTLPTEQTKLRTAITGPTMAFSIAGSGAGALWMNSTWKTLSGTCAMNPASRNPIVISRHSICQSPRKLWATSDHACTEVSR